LTKRRFAAIGEAPLRGRPAILQPHLAWRFVQQQREQPAALEPEQLQMPRPGALPVRRKLRGLMPCDLAPQKVE
jgi:hypothetical protein